MSKKELIAKAKGIIEGVERMGNANASNYASGRMASDYNKLKLAVAMAYEELNELLPPLVKCDPDDPDDGDAYSKNYDIQTFTLQILKMLEVD